MVARTVFVSYAREDDAEVQPAVELLRAGGVKVFFDVQNIEFGEKWKQALQAALSRCERVMVFWSAAAAASEWVEREWRIALNLGKKIVPTLLDLTPLPSELAEFQAIRRLRKGDEPWSDSGRVSPAVRTPPSRRLLVWIAAFSALAIACSFVFYHQSYQADERELAELQQSVEAQRREAQRREEQSRSAKQIEQQQRVAAAEREAEERQRAVRPSFAEPAPASQPIPTRPARVPEPTYPEATPTGPVILLIPLALIALAGGAVAWRMRRAPRAVTREAEDFVAQVFSS